MSPVWGRAIGGPWRGGGRTAGASCPVWCLLPHRCPHRPVPRGLQQLCPEDPPHGLPGPRAQDGLPASSPRAPAVRARVTAAWPGPGRPELCNAPACPPCLLPRCLTCCPWVRGPRRCWVFASCSGVGTEAAEIAPRAARLSSARHVLTTVRNPHDSPLRVTN